MTPRTLSRSAGRLTVALLALAFLALALAAGLAAMAAGPPTAIGRAAPAAESNAHVL